MSNLCKPMSRLIAKFFPHDDPADFPNECYACTRVGVPVFHSTTCDPVHKPEWEASAGSSLVPISNRWRKNRVAAAFSRGSILDPRSPSMQRWNRVVVLARGVSLAVDPLFFFAISVGGGGGGTRPCVFMDGGVGTVATVLRTCVDLVHACHLGLRFRLAYVSEKTLVIGCGKLVWDARAIASRYFLSFKGFWFDAFVLLPIPQAVYWVVVPILLRKNRIEEMMSVLQLTFLLQFLPKVYHCFCLMKGMRKVTGYIFGTVWWGFGLNLIVYFLASHFFVQASGGYWYILAVRRVSACLNQQFETGGNDLSLSCSREVCYPSYEDLCGNNSSFMVKKPMCFDINGPFPYGIYQFALPLMLNNSITTKLLYSNLWGLMGLSTMGNNLEPTSQFLEVLFSIFIVLCGLLLFTMLIGNIQVFLHAVMARRRKMQLRHQDMEWWMKHRQLPSSLRRRVRRYERQRWVVMGGEDEMEMIKDLPEGLRRDIKRHICMDLIDKVPLFHNLNDLVLDNIYDRVKPLVYSRNEKIIREGDPVHQLMFIIRGSVERNQNLSKGTMATSILEPGSFLGDELISWCLRRPFHDRLPASFATFTCTKPTEVFSLGADDLRYITDHFRYHFANEALRRTARYYSSNWRTWAAVIIQMAWRRYRRRTRSPVRPGLDDGGGDGDHRLRKYAAMFMSLRPHDHLE